MLVPLFGMGRPSVADSTLRVLQHDLGDIDCTDRNENYSDELIILEPHSALSYSSSTDITSRPHQAEFERD